MLAYIAMNGAMEGYYEFWSFDDLPQAIAYLEKHAKDMAFVGILKLENTSGIITQIMAGEINWPKNYKDYHIVWDDNFEPRIFVK